MYLLWILTIVITLSEALEVNFTSDWRENVGWDLLCAWSFTGADSLQSVRLSKEGAQFKIYRPQIHGSQLHREEFLTPDYKMHLKCSQQGPRNGRCALEVEPLHSPPNVTKFSCEVSGEAPTFTLMHKDLDLEAFVPPNKALLKAKIQVDQTASRVTLNCTAAGLPAPLLNLFVENQKVTPDFTGVNWNTKTKLLDVWSTLSLTKNSNDVVPVKCIPEQRFSSGHLFTGALARYQLQGQIGNGNRITNTSSSENECAMTEAQLLSNTPPEITEAALSANNSLFSNKSKEKYFNGLR